MQSSERVASENEAERASGRDKVWFMTILILEALGAGALLIFIVWWTMFSGRKGGEPPDHATPPEAPKAEKDIKPGA